MRPLTANANDRLLFWSHVREFAVPTSMIESATARRAVGDWSGACAAARVDVDLDLRAVGRAHGQQFAAQVRADLRQLAPDLLRWHFPRIRPDGLASPSPWLATQPYTSWHGRRLRGQMPVNGSASRCGTGPGRTLTGVSVSTCTAIYGTRAGPVSCGNGPGVATGGWPKRLCCCARMNVRTASSPCGSINGTA
ncbi:hypothetical protein [Kibdelosporangium philippinense]|uniref:hypothetical protein n=1 Tax=Kibdelosporangium philippinense TaxID=211113 RepID=UPI00361FF157